MDRAMKSQAVSVVVVLTCCLAAGCTCVKHARSTEAVAPSPPAASTQVAGTAAPAVPTVAVTPAGVETSDAHVTPPPTPVIQAAPPAKPAPAPQTALPKAPARAPAVIPTATPRPSPKPAAAVVIAPAPAAPQAIPKVATTPLAPTSPSATLDLKSLESRLRETKAIGMLTKLSLKNQVDDLIEGFRDYHRRQGTVRLADLRRNYDMLVLKVLSLLQDSDPALARDIVKSRTAIWNILEDSRKFTDANLMAGATP